LITLYISAALSHLIPTENIKFPFRGDAALIFIKFNIKGRHPSIRKSIAETGAHFFWANTFGNLSYYFAAHLTFGCRGRVIDFRLRYRNKSSHFGGLFAGIRMGKLESATHRKLSSIGVFATCLSLSPWRLLFPRIAKKKVLSVDLCGECLLTLYDYELRARQLQASS